VLDREGLNLNQDSFRRGYIAGWQSVKGANEHPDAPEAPAEVGVSLYLIGFSRGIRDAAVGSVPTPRLPSAPPQ
jgi:hypothetical protein